MGAFLDAGGFHGQLSAFHLHRMTGISFVFMNQAIVQMDHAMAAVGDGGIVCHEDDRTAGGDQLIKQRENLHTCFAVECPGGFIRE